MQRRRSQHGRRSRGTAAVELAVCLPILMLFVVGTIETSNMIFLKQVLTHASYEAARVASRPNAKNADPGTRANAILNAQSVNTGSVGVVPLDIEATNRGSNIVVTVSAPANANSLIPFSHFAGQTLSVSMTSVKN